MIASGVEVRQVGSFFWCTITAPGSDVLPWDVSVCGHLENGSECSGSKGCRVEMVPAAVFNGTAPRRWSWFVTYLRRRLGHCEFVGVWEDQERGVLHRHFLIRLDRPSTERRVRAAVRNSARRWGFGSQYDVRSITGDAAREAWYIASYATKTVDRIGDRARLDVRTGELRCDRAGFRAWSASRHWGESMKSVRARQCAWARASGRGGARDEHATAGAGAGGAGLDPNSEISTDGEAQVVDLLRVELGAVLL